MTIPGRTDLADRAPEADGVIEQPLLPGVPGLPQEEKPHPQAGQLVAGIDVGSNAMRLKIAQITTSGGLIPVVEHREAVRLGEDAFRDKLIGSQTLTATVEAFGRFRRLLDSYEVSQLRAVATSALREAQNQLEIISFLYEETGIQLEVIPALEEAELVVRAVTRSIENPAGNLLIIDVGGGSIEVSVVEHGRIIAIESFSVGTVRMLQYLRDQTSDELQYPHFIQAHIAFMRNRLERLLTAHPVDQVIAIGGNAGSLAALANSGPQGDSDEGKHGQPTQILTLRELNDLIDLIDSLASAQRVALLGLGERRADVIQPAAHLYASVLEASGIEAMLVPGVGVRDGLLWEMVDPNLVPVQISTSTDQVWQMAIDIAERYRVDRAHAEQVAWLAGRLFDDLQSIHRLGAMDRNYLLAAAVLHDVGHLVNHGRHHLHTYYLIKNADFYGLTAREQEIVALVARFHRKSPPSADRHPEFAALPHQDRVRVTKLAALLRVADALDRAHARAVTTLEAVVSENKITLRIAGPADTNIEAWAVGRSAVLFKRVFLCDIKLQLLEEGDHE